MTELYLTGNSYSFQQTVVGYGDVRPPYVLASFYYIHCENRQEWMLDYRDEPDCAGFLLDSGAYTWEESQADGATEADLDAYLGAYIDFINTHDVDRFFSLDVDAIVGTARVRDYRDRLERETDGDCIPVWHLPRGWDAFTALAGDYDAVAIGGVNREITGAGKENLWRYQEYAAAHGADLHILGHSPRSGPTAMRFDSVDSSSWVTDARFRRRAMFDGLDIQTEELPPSDDTRYREIERHNLREWTRYANAIRS